MAEILSLCVFFFYFFSLCVFKVDMQGCGQREKDSLHPLPNMLVSSETEKLVNISVY